MISAAKQKEYYRALLKKSPEYDGVFYVGVKSTGVFCRSTCTARKPQFASCEFYKTAKEALLASFRPCKRCRPLSPPNQASPLIQKLVAAVESNPEKRWRNRDFQELSVDASTARRQFQKRFNMTFVEYARARRMGIAMKHVRDGASVIEAQLSTGYESGSGFRDAFFRIMGAAPAKSGQIKVLKATWIDTPLGPMIAIADDDALYLLEFVDRRGLELEVKKMRQRFGSAVVPGHAAPIHMIEQELGQYFDGSLTHFKTPLNLKGSPFQQRVWQELLKIPLGETRSYSDIARSIGKPTAFRAVANANGANQLAIIVPCHRVVNLDGRLGGYGGGVARKKWLLEHERR